MTTLHIVVVQIALLPRIFAWILAPSSLVALLLALRRRTRPAALVGFVAVAALSLALVLIAAVSIIYAGWQFGRVAIDLVMNLGPSATFDFLASLLRVTGIRPIDFALVIATTLGSSIAAVALGWARSEGGRLQQSSHSLVPPAPTTA